jgi:hypothetical protein
MISLSRTLIALLFMLLATVGSVGCDGRSGIVGVQSRILPRACTTTDMCSAEQPVCGAAGFCTACRDDSDCSGGRPRCAPSGACVECTDHTQCNTATEACSPEGRCETRCSSMLPCDMGEVCATTATASVCAECTVTDVTQCDQDKPVCDPDLLRCTECVSNLDCGVSTPACVGGKCEKCYDNNDCASGETCGPSFECSATCASDANCTDGDIPHCARAIGVCVECVLASDCADPTPNCVANQCEN